MRHFLLAMLTMAVSCVSAQQLVKYELIDHIDKATMEGFWESKELPEFITSVSNDIEVYELYYNTSLPNGKSVIATGLYFVPVDYNNEIATILYNHGTVVQNRVGEPYDYNGETAICKFFSADGYAVAWQDYIGLGKGEGFHPYQHSESEAQSGIDLLKALKEMNQLISLEVNDQLFVTGHSQGGHATLAVHKMIQEEFANELTVTASSPMSGTYDVSGIQNMAMDGEYAHPNQLPYLMYGYQKIYKIFPNEEEFMKIFKPQYSQVLEQIFAKATTEYEINELLPDNPYDILKPHIYKFIKEDPEFLFTKKLRENDTYKWVPEAPVQYCYCQGDDEVYYKNSIVAMNWMKENGAKQIYDKKVSDLFNHYQCADYAVMYTKVFFDSYRKGDKGNIMKNALIKKAVKQEEKALRMD